MEIQSAFMGAAAAAVLLVAILVQRRESAALWFAGLTFAYGAWCLGRGMAGAGVAWGRPLADVALVCLGPLAITAAAALLGRLQLLARAAPALCAGTLLLLAALARFGADLPELHAAVHLWTIAGVIGGAVLLARLTPRAHEDAGPDTIRLRYLSIAYALVVIGVGADTVMWQLDLPRVGALLAPLLFLYAGYLHLSRVRVADLRQLIGNAFALTLMAVGLAAFFAAIRIWVGERVDLFVFNAFVASFALLLAFEPVRNRIQGAMDRRFVAERLELERSLQPLVEQVTHVVTLDDVLQELLSTLEKTHAIRASSIFLRDDANLGFQQAGSIGLPPRTRVSLMRHPVFVSALEDGDGLVAADLERAHALARDPEEKTRLETLRRMLRDFDADIVLPLRGAEIVLGFWTLSDARSDESFSTDEVKMLRAVADQLAVGIENSRTFEQIRARDRLASLGEMATGLAHEIRNPLAAIRGAIAVLDSSGHSEDREFHEMIVEEIQRLDRVVETFLDYARPSTHSTVVQDIGAFVERCATSVQRARSRVGVRLSLDIEPDLPPIRIDAHQLERVIVNVVQNAYEALPEGGRVRVRVRREPGVEGAAPRVEVLIEDDGPGMDEETLQRAFVPFYTTKERGTGMGLALCERLIRAQNGTIELHSRPEQGTSVCIRLPADRSEPEAA